MQVPEMLRFFFKALAKISSRFTDKICMKKLNILSVLFVSFLLGFQLGCTRDPGANSLRFGIPLNSSGNSSLGEGEGIEFLLINLRTSPDAIPFHAECDFKHDHGGGTVGDGENADGDGEGGGGLEDHHGEGDIQRFPITCNQFPDFIEVVIDNAPKAPNLLVQVLTVSEDSTGGMSFQYGDSLVDSSATGQDTIADITTLSAGSSSKEGIVAGRYMTSATGGPSGELQTYFSPPGGQPPMLVEAEAMISGWFSVFMLDNQNLTYKVRTEGGQSITIFDKVNLSSPDFDTSGNPTYRMKVEVPASFRLDEKDGIVEIEQMLPQDGIVGFFGPVLSHYSSKEVCYNSVKEGLPELYADNALSAPMVWEGGSSGSGVKVVSGGVAKTSLQMQQSCNMATGNQISFIHTMLDGHMDDSVGFRGLLAKTDFFARWSDQVKAQFDGSTTINFNWVMLPGADAINDNPTQFDVYMKFDSTNNGSNGDFRCHSPPSDYSLVGSTPVSTLAYSYGSGVNSSNYYNYKFAFCPFFIDSKGKKISMVERAYEVHCMGGCSNEYGLGRAKPSDDISIAGTSDFVDAPVNGGYLIVNSDPVTAGGITTVGFHSSGTYTNFSEDDEVMFLVMGARGGQGCGMHQGQPIHPGEYEFARLLEVNSGSFYVKVKAGTFVDSLAASAWNSPSAADHCFVQMIKVVQVNDLTMTSTLSANNVGGSGFVYNHNGGGVIALRVNGTLNLGDNAMLNATAAGFLGGTSGTEFGAGHKGTTVAGALTTDGGEHNGAEGAGGAGFGNGGNTSGLNGGSSTGSSGWLRMMPGTGGGHSLAGDGGAGGGVIFVSAANVVISSSTTAPIIDASGDLGANGSYGAGGGGGGAISLMFRDVISTNGDSVIVKAEGGAGGTGSGQPGGGGGGGGSAEVLTCHNNETNISGHFNLMTNQGIFGTGTPSGNSGDPGQNGIHGDLHCD